jgi:hypothetical protein
MSLAKATQHRQRELAYRVNAGIEVVLFWHELTGAVTVSVSDTNSGAYFEVAADPAHALDVFDHPYAYAAFMGIPYDDELLATWAHAADQPHVVTTGAGGPTA